MQASANPAHQRVSETVSCMIRVWVGMKRPIDVGSLVDVGEAIMIAAAGDGGKDVTLGHGTIARCGRTC